MPRALEWAPAAEHDLRRLDHQTRERIRQAVYRLADTGQGDVMMINCRPAVQTRMGTVVARTGASLLTLLPAIPDTWTNPRRNPWALA